MNRVKAMTILVVDDESESRQVLVDILKAEGYEVRPADSGQLALASVMAQPPDLILLDIRMPDMDGFEVCRRLKSRAATEEIPVMFISASGELEEKVDGLRLGAVEVQDASATPVCSALPLVIAIALWAN